MSSSRDMAAVGKEFFSRHGGAVIITLLIVAGGLLYGWGMWFAPDELPGWPKRSTQPEHWLALHAQKLGLVVLGSGLVGAFVRFLHTMQVMRRTLAEVMLEDRFLEMRNDLPAIWKRLTRRLFLPGMDLTNANVEGLLERISSAQERRLTYNKDFLIRQLARTIDVEWHDRKKCEIRTRDTLTFVILPFRPKETINWESRFTPGNGMTLADYARHEEVSVVERGSGRTMTPKEWLDGDTYVKSFELGGGASYDIRKVVEKTFSLSDDPVVEIVSNHVIDGFSLDVNCDAVGVRCHFVEHGSQVGFKDHMDEQLKSRRPGDVRRICHDAMLPGDGFTLYFQVMG